MKPLAIVWFRRDLRLGDNPALQAAIERGYRVLPLYIDETEGEGDWPLGAAARAWLGRSLAALGDALAAAGTDLHCQRGAAEDLLPRLCTEHKVSAVFWNRRYEPAVRARDERLKSALRAAGIEAHSFNAALLNEPWTISTQQGQPYRVFTPYWKRASAELDQLPPALPAPEHIDGVRLEALTDHSIDPPRPRWDRGFWDHAEVGEAAAVARLQAFLDDIDDYAERRDFPAEPATSGLSPYLAFGEISPRQILQRIHDAGLRERAAGFVRELGWREFSYHLLFHFPASSDHDLTDQMRGFDWCAVDPSTLEAWQRGRSGIPILDAAMRELWQSGVMHNRCRMLVASFLSKNLRYHWLHGARWFWDTLVDADLANNTQGWQWSAGTGADAAPYFRIFNPITQAQRFDADGEYVRRWLPELNAVPAKFLHTPWQWDGLRRAVPNYPQRPMIDLKQSREAALDAYRRARSK